MQENTAYPTDFRHICGRRLYFIAKWKFGKKHRAYYCYHCQEWVTKND